MEKSKDRSRQNLNPANKRITATRHRFFLVKILLGLASPFLLTIGSFKLFTAEVLSVEGMRTEQQTVTIQATHRRLWGLVETSIAIDNVAGALIKTKKSRSRRSRGKRATAVYVTSQMSTSPIQLSPYIKSFSAEKQRLFETVETFVAAPDKKRFKITLDFRNVYDWVGLLMVTIGTYGTAWWLYPVIRDRLEKRRQKKILDERRTRYMASNVDSE